MNFKNKTALVTGAALGIGKAVAEVLAQNGSDLALLDLNIDNLNEVATNLKAYGGKVRVYACDVSDKNVVDNTVKKIIEEYSKIDILINNAGIWRDFRPFYETFEQDWQKIIDTNIYGVLNVTHAVIENLIKNKYGRIVNVASVAGEYGNANMAVYSMTKGAVISFTKSLAKELASCNITVNAVSPGTIAVDGETGENKLCYLNRVGTPTECAQVICFLASDKASYVSGQNYLVDGCRKKI